MKGSCGFADCGTAIFFPYLLARSLPPLQTRKAEPKEDTTRMSNPNLRTLGRHTLTEASGAHNPKDLQILLFNRTHFIRSRKNQNGSARGNWQGRRDSNPQRRFWRPLVYR